VSSKQLFTCIGMLMVACVLVTPTAIPQSGGKTGDKAEVLLAAAKHKQLVDGDLEAAIQQYKSIVANFSADHAVAAKALVEMGGCYEKLGKEEARKAYERVLRDYGDQSEAATQARTRLAALSDNGAPKASEMVARRVWAGPDVDTSGAVLPDGRFLTYVDWETGDLALRDLRTGEKRRLTNKGTWYSSHEFALSSVPSADGKQAAYTWFNKDFLWDLRVVGLDGSGPRVIYASKDVDYLQPKDWSPDGKFILTLISNQIALLPASGGPARVLKTLDSRYPEKMSFSPDGRYIAYDFLPEQDSRNHDISLLSADGSHEFPLVHHPADDRLLGWTPDGTKVLFASDRTGSMSLWSLEVANGKAQGAPELVKADVGKTTALGVTRKGAFYYGVQIGRQDVYLATLDETTGKLLTAPSPVTQRYVGSNSSPYWSPDGQYLAYKSQRGHSQVGVGSKVIVIRSIKTSEERELALKLNDFQLGPWSQDGRCLLLTGTDTKGRQGIFRTDTETAEVYVLLSEPGTDLCCPKWSPDGEAIFFRRGTVNGKSASLVVRDLETGREKEIYQATLPSFIEHDAEVSPDGAQWAFTMFQSRNQPELLMVVSTSGAEPRRLLEVHEPEIIHSVGWTPDSRYILFTWGRGGTFPKLKWELWRIPAGGGEPEKLGLPQIDALPEVRFHRDGRRIAFTAGQDKSEVWVLENFLPLEKVSR